MILILMGDGSSRTLAPSNARAARITVAAPIAGGILGAALYSFVGF